MQLVAIFIMYSYRLKGINYVLRKGLNNNYLFNYLIT